MERNVAKLLEVRVFLFFFLFSVLWSSLSPARRFVTLMIFLSTLWPGLRTSLVFFWRAGRRTATFRWCRFVPTFRPRGRPSFSATRRACAPWPGRRPDSEERSALSAEDATIWCACGGCRTWENGARFVLSLFFFDFYFSYFYHHNRRLLLLVMPTGFATLPGLRVWAELRERWPARRKTRA